MKKTITFACMLAFVFFYSCKKKDTVPTTLDLLQHKWTDDSLVNYGNPNFIGVGLKAPGLQGYTDFRTDGKIYSFSSLTSNGQTESTYDTAVYTLKDNLIISFSITDGVQSTSADTAMINTLTDQKLVASNVSKDSDGFYSKIYLHR